LESPYVVFLGNDKPQVRRHFYGLREAKRDLVGFALFDHDVAPDGDLYLTCHSWRRREIENYLCSRETLLAWTTQSDLAREAGLFAMQWEAVMEESIRELERSLDSLGKPSPWSDGLKVSDEFLTPLFRLFFRKIQTYNLMDKSNFHVLAQYVPVSQIDPEVAEVLDAIIATAKSAKPVGDVGPTGSETDT
jgi:hypothetical protein